MAARVSSQITPDKVQEAVRRIVHAGRPRKVILFGSYVSGKTKRDSDLDILVIGDDTIPDTRTESVRIRRFLRGLMMPMDILVVRESQYNALKDRPALIYREIEKTGKVVYDGPIP